jgi:hypothetical protein
LVTIRSNVSALNRFSDLSENSDSHRFPVPEYGFLVNWLIDQAQPSLGSSEDVR